MFPNLRDPKTGGPLIYEINREIALYVLDGDNRRERLKASSREHPLTSYRASVWYGGKSAHRRTTITTGRIDAASTAQ